MELKGSQTEKNLKAALAGESIARNKYTYFAAQARKDGREELAKMYERLAVNESTHAKFWYTAIHGPIQGTLENLQISAAGELEEWSNMYPAFAKTAREEGFEELAVMFEHVADIEKTHEKQFMEAIIREKSAARASQPVEASAPVAKAAPAPVVKQPQTKTGYRCAFCGAIYDERHDVCPICQAIGSFEPSEYQV